VLKEKMDFLTHQDLYELTKLTVKLLQPYNYVKKWKILGEDSIAKSFEPKNKLSF
jgi:hypothetical protein